MAFRQVGTASSVVTSGEYAFINSAPTPGAETSRYSGGTLVNEQTGRRISVKRSGCFAVLLAGDLWVVFYCPYGRAPAYVLYSLRRGRATRTLLASDGRTPVAIGAHWIEERVVRNGGEVFLSTDTGATRALRSWRSGGVIAPDLWSRSLRRRLCSPLRVPADWAPHAGAPARSSRPGTVTSFARFAVLQGTTAPTRHTASIGMAFVERCGSRKRHSINPLGEIPINQGIWEANSAMVLSGGDYERSLAGWLLPSVTAIRVPVPGYNQGLTAPYSMSIGARQVYLVDYADQLWVAAIPSGLRGR